MSEPKKKVGESRPANVEEFEPPEHSNFRPNRFGPDDLGPVEIQIILEVDEKTHHCTLHDVSQNGVAFERPPGVDIAKGDRVRRVTVICESHIAYKGEAEVRTVRKEDGHVIIGLTFLDSLMNMEDVLQLRDMRERWDDPELVLHARNQAWHSGAEEAHRFEALVAELHLFLREAKARFEPLERDIPWHILHGEADCPARRALTEKMREGFIPEYIRYTERIDAAWRQVPESENDKLKAFSRGLLHETITKAPFMHRCLTKPLGYPGDYEVMRYLYEQQLEGPDLLSKGIHLASVMTKGAQAVRERKDLLRRVLVGLTRERAAKGLETRALSVAAGPAQEVYEILTLEGDLGPGLNVLLFDQDQYALEYASRRFALAAGHNPRSDISVQLRHDTIRRLLNDDEIFAEQPAVDIIFVAGLFDYLRKPTARKLIAKLHRLLAPGGQLYVGNMVPENPCRWFLEHHLDWFLLYRSREELLAMGEEAVPGARTWIVNEPTSVNPFLVIQRS
jgi:extracellular factor (EF) 3-hydroxypalmitic acid methyl ester biosynthesis protein